MKCSISLQTVLPLPISVARRPCPASLRTLSRRFLASAGIPLGNDNASNLALHAIPPHIVHLFQSSLLPWYTSVQPPLLDRTPLPSPEELSEFKLTASHDISISISILPCTLLASLRSTLNRPAAPTCNVIILQFLSVRTLPRLDLQRLLNVWFLNLDLSLGIAASFPLRG